MLSLPKHLYRAACSVTRQGCLNKLSMPLLELFPLLVIAQSSPNSQVYAYVEQMPQLPSGGGTAAIVAEVQRRTHYPAVIRHDGEMRYSGIRYTFIVSPSGNVHDAAMVIGSSNQEVDQAILAAVRALPTFKPGMQHGQRVPVRFTLTISCIKIQ
jgi:protein TonB